MVSLIYTCVKSDLYGAILANATSLRHEKKVSALQQSCGLKSFGSVWYKGSCMRQNRTL